MLTEKDSGAEMAGPIIAFMARVATILRGEALREFWSQIGNEAQRQWFRADDAVPQQHQRTDGAT